MVGTTLGFTIRKLDILVRFSNVWDNFAWFLWTVGTILYSFGMVRTILDAILDLTITNLIFKMSSFGMIQVFEGSNFGSPLHSNDPNTWLGSPKFELWSWPWFEIQTLKSPVFGCLWYLGIQYSDYYSKCKRPKNEF